ncbi:hypothetical protein IFM89_029888 [Coptis chinensis]|uniref:Transposase n=1 Tax=Coptis chinensis TaxID=261450 RepID=A0A835HI88_9MAGN|nr:hypothetical protein IFM89_029888 [Coptis chinensis]
MVMRAESWELKEISWKDPTLGPISGDEFRNKKSKWKRNFYTRYTTYEERLSHRPPQLSPEEWVQLVEFWDTPEHQAISKRNKANRAKQIVKHTAGRISFPQFEEIMSEEAGAPPSLGDLFVMTHISLKMHDTLDDQSRDYIVCDKMKELAGRDEEGTQQPLTNEIYREVMPLERHGCVRLKGRGVTPTSYFGSQLSLDNPVNDLGNQVAEMQRVAQEKEEERQREIEEIRMQAQEKDEQRQREMDEMKRLLNARDVDMEARLMQKLLEITATCSRIKGIIVGIVGNSTTDNGGNATFGIVGIVGIVGIEGSVGKLVLDNGGIVSFSRDGMLGREGIWPVDNGGNVTVGRVGIAGIGVNVGIVGIGIVGILGKVGAGGVSNKWRVAILTLMLDNIKATNKNRMESLNDAIKLELAKFGWRRSMQLVEARRTNSLGYKKTIRPKSDKLITCSAIMPALEYDSRLFEVRPLARVLIFKAIANSSIGVKFQKRMCVAAAVENSSNFKTVAEKSRKER